MGLGEASQTSSPEGDAPATVETSAARLRADVLEPSLRQLVLLQFFVPASAACEKTTAALESAVKAAQGKLRLVKMNRDANPQVAAQLGVRTLPAVVLFDRGRPSDGFAGALPQKQIKGFLERFLGPLQMGGDLWEDFARHEAEGETEKAEAILRQMLAETPAQPKALTQLLKLLVSTGRFEEGDALVANAAETLRADAAFAATVAAMDNAKQASGLGEIGDLRRRAQENPDDHQARFDLALALNARGQRDEAAAELLDIFRRDRSWNDDGARKPLIHFFDAWGPNEKATIAARRRLSSLLFS
jgi:putative thioredoxin